MKNLFSSLKYDVPASVVVFLVALPLCLGIALASGAPMFSGIIAGVVGGIVVGMLSGSHTSVSGPAAGLALIVFNAIEELGDFEIFLLAVIIAGILQVIFGIIKAGIVGLYFPSSVIRGMLAAIGLTLILKQIPHLVGVDLDTFGDEGFSQRNGENTFTQVAYAAGHFIQGSMAIGLVAILVLLFWDSRFIKSNKVLSQIPGGLIAVLFGVFLNFLFTQYLPDFAVSREHLVRLPEFDSFESLTFYINFPDYSELNNYAVYKVAFTVAVIASLETLLSLEAVDKIDPEKRMSPPNRELIAQGVANIGSGLIGGLPVTAVIVRSSANLNAGSKTKLSAILHGVLLMLTVLFIPGILNMIPLSALAAILILVGFKLTKPELYIQHFKKGKDQFLPFVITVMAILFTDLLVGIGIGLFAGMFFILYSHYKMPYSYHEEVTSEGNKNIITIKLSENVSFLNKVNLQMELMKIKGDYEVVIDGTQSKTIDHDVLEVIASFKEKAQDQNITLTLRGIPQIK